MRKAAPEAICGNTGPDAGEATGWFLGLLVGGLQIRRVIHDCPEPSGE